jgi:tripartite-type tricarboxylate transporter receptor subunit TctC
MILHVAKHVALAWAVAWAAGPAAAEDFYQGRTVTVVVGNSAGGYDTYARVLARHMGRHIPGNPDMIVVNMPGAGTLKSVLYLDNTAPKDGTVIDTFNSGLIDDSRINPDAVKVDFRKFAWLGSVSPEYVNCYVWHTLGVHTLAELKAHGPVHLGVSSRGGSADVDEKLMRSILGVDVRQVTGYPGSNEQRLAIERGELDGNCGGWGSLPADWIAGHKIIPIFRTSPDPIPGMPPGVPYMGDLASSPRDKAIIRFINAPGELGRPFIMSEAVPADRVKLLREAFDATMKDDGFLAEMHKLKLEVSPLPAAGVAPVLAQIYGAPDDIIATARKLVRE